MVEVLLLPENGSVCSVVHFASDTYRSAYHALRLTHHAKVQ